MFLQRWVVRGQLRHTFVIISPPISSVALRDFLFNFQQSCCCIHLFVSHVHSRLSSTWPLCGLQRVRLRFRLRSKWWNMCPRLYPSPLEHDISSCVMLVLFSSVDAFCFHLLVSSTCAASELNYQISKGCCKENDGLWFQCTKRLILSLALSSVFATKAVIFSHIFLRPPFYFSLFNCQQEVLLFSLFVSTLAYF